MALPQQVIDRLGKESPKTPGWSVGALSFAFVIFIIAVAAYAGITFVYEPIINSQINSMNDNINTLAQSISPSDESQLVTFYSQIANIQSTLQTHVVFSQFLTWLEHDTEQNVYFTALTYSSQNTITMTGSAKNEADVNQQAAIFESDPMVQSMSLTSITLAPSGAWTFSVGLILKPALFLPPTVAPANASTTTTQ